MCASLSDHEHFLPTALSIEKHLFKANNKDTKITLIYVNIGSLLLTWNRYLITMLSLPDHRLSTLAVSF